MTRARLALCLAAALAALLATPGSSLAAGSSDVAALQVALRARNLYHGTIDGLPGEATTNAVVALQRRAGLAPDGVAGPDTRVALGELGAPELGSRTLGLGAVGWDVAELQFDLAWHGFPSGPFDGAFGSRTETAVRRFQRSARLPDLGVAGPETLRALEAPIPRSPLRLSEPLDAPLGDGFGPRGDRFHAGIDFGAPKGAVVGAARGGTVTFAAPLATWGRLVVVAHGRGVRTLYAHLSRIDVRVGQRVAAGEPLGLVGASGNASGPHLHFEVRVRGAAVDPLPAFG